MLDKLTGSVRNLPPAIQHARTLFATRRRVRNTMNAEKPNEALSIYFGATASAG